MKRSVEDTSIVFIGAGNLASNLARALYHKGFRIVQVYSRTEASAQALASQVEADYTTELSQINHESQLYIIALKDSALVQLLPQIAAINSNALFVHTAGSIPMSIFEEHFNHYGVFYPMQTFSKERQVDFEEVPIFLEAHYSEDLVLLQSLASILTTKVYEADSHKRKILHLSAVFVCNFTNHMYALSEKLLHEQGLPFDAMLSLIDETARKVHTISPKEAQTGPAIRYDKNVINNHLAMLEGDPSLQEVYKLISKSIYEHNKL